MKKQANQKSMNSFKGFHVLVWTTIVSVLFLFVIFVVLICSNKNIQNTKELVRLQSKPTETFEIVRLGKNKPFVYLKNHKSKQFVNFHNPEIPQKPQKSQKPPNPRNPQTDQQHKALEAQKFKISGNKLFLFDQQFYQPIDTISAVL